MTSRMRNRKQSACAPPVFLPSILRQVFAAFDFILHVQTGLDFRGHCRFSFFSRHLLCYVNVWWMHEIRLHWSRDKNSCCHRLNSVHWWITFNHYFELQHCGSYKTIFHFATAKQWANQHGSVYHTSPPVRWMKVRLFEMLNCRWILLKFLFALISLSMFDMHCLLLYWALPMQFVFSIKAPLPTRTVV